MSVYFQVTFFLPLPSSLLKPPILSPLQENNSWQSSATTRLLQRKRHIKIELGVRLSVLRLFHVGNVVQSRRSALSLTSRECFSCKGKEWKIYCCGLALLASDLEAFVVFCQYPAWVYYASKPIENAFYCLKNSIREKHHIEKLTVCESLEFWDSPFSECGMFWGLFNLPHGGQLSWNREKKSTPW